MMSSCGDTLVEVGVGVDVGVTDGLTVKVYLHLCSFPSAPIPLIVIVWSPTRTFEFTFIVTLEVYEGFATPD